MAATKYRITKFYKAQANLLGGEVSGDTFAVDYLSDTIKCMLTTSTYAPNLSTHETKSDVTNEVSGTNYTAGGVALGSKTITVTDANSWGVSRANSTAYVVGDVFRPASANGFLYMVVVAGTSAASPPTFPTTRLGSVADGTATIVNVGPTITVQNGAISFTPNVTIAATRYGVVYKDTGTASTSPLLYLIEFLASDGTTPDDASVSNSTLTITLDTNLGLASSFVLPGVGI